MCLSGNNSSSSVSPKYDNFSMQYLNTFPFLIPPVLHVTLFFYCFSQIFLPLHGFFSSSASSTVPINLYLPKRIEDFFYFSSVPDGLIMHRISTGVFLCVGIKNAPRKEDRDTFTISHPGSISIF
jgi:hypothetical protein